MWSLLAIALGHAAAPTVLGVDDARSVVLIVASGVEERSARCDDLNGDGLWRCPVSRLPARPDGLGLLIDGATLLSATAVDLGDAPDAVTIERVGEVLRVRSEPVAPRAASPEARPGAAALIVEIRGGDGVPRLSVSGERAQVELSCTDGGTFPDRQANDGTWSCAGVAPDGDLSLTVRGSSGAPLAAGPLRWPPEQGLRQVRVDEGGAAVASWPVLSRGAMAERSSATRPTGAEPRREDGAQARPGGSPPGGAPPGGAPPGGAPPGGAPPGAQVGGASGQGGWTRAMGLSALGAALLGLLAWRIGRDRGSPVPHAQLAPLPPVVAGGPAGSALLRVPPGRSAEAAAWIAGRTAGIRPVLLVGAGAPIAALGPVWVARSRDADDLAEAARALARRATCPPLVLATPGAISAAGAVGITPESALLRALPDGAILALLHESGPSPVALPEITLNTFLGEWRAT